MSKGYERTDFSDTLTGRPICRDPEEILRLASVGVPLRRVEIYTMAKASGQDIVSQQMLEMIEKSAMAKLRAAIDISPSELHDGRPRPAKRRRIIR